MKHEIPDEIVSALDQLLDYTEDEEAHFLDGNGLEKYAAEIDPNHIWHRIKLVDHWLAVIMSEKFATAEPSEPAAV